MLVPYECFWSAKYQQLAVYIETAACGLFLSTVLLCRIIEEGSTADGEYNLSDCHGIDVDLYASIFPCQFKDQLDHGISNKKR